ncbi:MAG TPA: S8 family serine peptidase, partial [Rhodothermales bacterium]|nr:S8 family serine peptidase [Rhodothermales bacterium]
NIRVVSNSFGNTGDVGTDFDPNDPTNVATKALADRGIVVVFSAGNSGAGESTITGNFKKAPWIVMAAAGDREGNLAGFSSRGRRGHSATVEIDGETYTWTDRPTVTAPGVAVVSTRASTGGSTTGQDDDLVLPPAYLPFYTILSGTSMACPHVSGIVALMLEANPSLNAYDVRRILEATATNMTGREPYEVGAGYANAYNAVVMALGRRTDFGVTTTLARTFNSVVDLNDVTTTVPLTYDPSGLTTKTYSFTVALNSTAQIAARVSMAGVLRETGNTVGIRFVAPDGRTYTSGITALFAISYVRTVVVDNPMPGTWRMELYGANGAGILETANATLLQRFLGTQNGLGDVSGHAVSGSIVAAVADRLADGVGGGVFAPEAPLTRGQLAQYLTYTGARQSLRLTGGFTFGDVPAALAPFAEAVAARGAALKDRFHTAGPVMRTSGGLFRPSDAVTRAELAYSLVQSLGLESVARSFTGTPAAEYDGKQYPLTDADAIPADLKGYVQIAISLGILDARFSLEQGPYDLAPTLKARFEPNATVTRAAYAVAATRFFVRYNQVGLAESLGNTETGTTPALSQNTATPQVNADGALSFESVHPNPARDAATVRFRLPESQRVRLAVYDAVGREVAVLADGELAVGSHTAHLEGSALAAGVYVMRLTSPAGVLTRTVTLVK